MQQPDTGVLLWIPQGVDPLIQIDCVDAEWKNKYPVNFAESQHHQSLNTGPKSSVIDHSPLQTVTRSPASDHTVTADACGTLT